MTFDFNNSLKKVSDFVQAGKRVTTSFPVPNKIGSLVPEFVHTVSTVVCEEKNIQKLLEDLNVLINTEYLINVNDLNIETKYQGIVSLTEKVVNVIIERGSCGHDLAPWTSMAIRKNLKSKYFAFLNFCLRYFTAL